MTAEPHSVRHVLPDGEFVARLAVGRPIEQAFTKIQHWMRDAQKHSINDT